MARFMGTVVVTVAGLAVAVPLVNRLVDALVIPAIVGVALYIVVRIVNAHFTRW